MAFQNRLRAPGLRIGHCIANKKVIDAMVTIQSQTTSGASSLIQRALIDFNFKHLENFFEPVKVQLRESADIVREAFRESKLPHCWYQTTSAFYFLIDFSRTPVFERYRLDKEATSKQIEANRSAQISWSKLVLHWCQGMLSALPTQQDSA